MNKKAQPTSYYHKPPLRRRDFEIHYNKDRSLKHIVRNSHKNYEFYFLISGDVTYYVDSISYHLQPGDVVLIAPEQVHEAFINAESQAYERYVLWLNSEFLEKLSSSRTDLLLPFQKTYISSARISPAPDQKLSIHSLLERILISSTSQEYGSDLMTNSYIIELLVHIAKIKLFQKDYYFERSIRHDQKNSSLVSDILAYINEHIYEEISIEQLTSLFFFSRSHLNKVFNEEIGMPLHQFIVKKKLFLARQDLLTNESVNHICTKYNFGNYTSFFRAFKQEFGQSPREFRKNTDTVL